MGHTTALIADLIDILTREQASTQVLLRLLEEERGAIRSFSSEQLEACVAAKFRTLRDIEALEAQRDAVVGALAGAWEADPDSLTLEAIATRLPTEEADRLRRCSDRLKASVRAALEVSRLNGSVITRIRSFFDRSLSGWHSAGEPPGLYSQAGLLRPAGPGGRLVQRKG